MINVSQAAAEHIHYLKKREKRGEDTPLRISVKEGGCSGFSYKLSFDNNEKGQADELFVSNGIPLVIEKKNLLYVMGMVLDFNGGLEGKGFVFLNPNAKDTCGCGFSFGV